MHESELVPHLFKTEYSKMVAVLTKSFGLHNVETAEDMVSDTFVSALDTWPYKGTPANPTAWLYTVAKNKLNNHLKRIDTHGKIIKKYESIEPQPAETDIDFSEHHISDSQLQMLFAICHQSISAEAQICLALRWLCGFGLDEIADALLTNKETIHKRIQRAKAKLQAENIQLIAPTNENVSERLPIVLHIIYLLFSEGYYSENNGAVIRKELCAEALNLAYLLLNHEPTNTHESNSLMALMCFQSSRLAARQSTTGDLILYDDQDRALWDTAFIEKGFHFLQQASKSEPKSTYYIEACIAYWHTLENTNPDKWISILKLYDQLLVSNPSPVVALNRVWAFAKVHGYQLATIEAEALPLQHNHFYHILLAELYVDRDPDLAKFHLKKAVTLCKNETEESQIEQKLSNLNGL